MAETFSNSEDGVRRSPPSPVEPLGQGQGAHPGSAPPGLSLASPVGCSQKGMCGELAMTEATTEAACELPPTGCHLMGSLTSMEAADEQIETQPVPREKIRRYDSCDTGTSSSALTPIPGRSRGSGSTTASRPKHSVSRQTLSTFSTHMDSHVMPAVQRSTMVLRNSLHGALVPGERGPYREHSFLTKIVTHRYFESLTLLVISMNAVWIGVDTEFNRDASTWLDAELQYKIADNGFCAFFSLEVFLRFCAYRRKTFALQDKSFLFDAALVGLMIFETWLVVITVALGGSSVGGLMRQFSILRLLRLLRLTRMVRLMRALPELMTLVKGLVAAVRSVTIMLLFLLGVIWVFAIIFMQHYKDKTSELTGYMRDTYFGSLGMSMITLIVYGALLDDISVLCETMIKDSYGGILLCIFLIFTLFSSLTLLNMLIGTLSEVVGNTAKTEKANLAEVQAKRTLGEIFRHLDNDGNESISYKEFQSLISSPESKSVLALKSLGISEDRLEDLAKQIFEMEGDDSEACSKASRSNDGVSDSQTSGPGNIRHASSDRGNCGPGGGNAKSAWVDDAGSMKSGASISSSSDKRRPLSPEVGGRPPVSHMEHDAAVMATTNKELGFSRFMDEIMALKPDGAISVHELQALRRISVTTQTQLDTQLSQMEEKISMLVARSGGKESRNASPARRASPEPPILTNQQLGAQLGAREVPSLMSPSAAQGSLPGACPTPHTANPARSAERTSSVPASDDVSLETVDTKILLDELSKRLKNRGLR